MLESILTTLDGRMGGAVEGLCRFLRFPSISTQPEHAGDVRACAEFLAQALRDCALEAQVYPTPVHPVVMARNAHRAGRPTVLYYGHYDVQPPDPLELWTTPPFEPVLRKTPAGHDAIFARGASDDKGQIWAHIEALRAWNGQGGLPVNWIGLFEGEEEIGSPSLLAFLREHSAQLKADLAVVSDNAQYSRDVPAVTYGLRGMTYLEIVLTTLGHDLHSGLAGGPVPNAAQILCHLVDSLHDSQGRINIPGFYDDVTPLTQAERDAWAKLPCDDPAYLREIGATALCGEAGYTANELRWGRPTCEVNGLTSGYQGVGAKTIVPAQASAKISMRLVPRQDPRKIAALFQQAFRQRAPRNAQLRFQEYFLADPIQFDLGGKAMAAAAKAVEIGFGKKPAFVRGGGSIPVVSWLKQILGLDTLLVGFGLPDNRTHIPNEKFDLDSLHWGMRMAAAIYAEIAKL